MIEAYAFFAAFLAQILVVSVLCPLWLAQYACAKAQAQLPGWDSKSVARFFRNYRVVNAVIALFGLGLLVWLFIAMQRPDWDVRPVMGLLAGYAMAQMLPSFLVSLIAAWIKKKALARTPPEARRTVSLQRRGLFDIVSPLTVFIAVLAYFLFAAFVIYIRQHPFPGFAGYGRLRTAALSLLGMVTLVYALHAFLVYWMLYRRKRWPLETSAYRLRAVEVQVKLIFYVSIVVVVFVPLNVMLALLRLPKWSPVMMSIYIIAVMLILSMMFLTLRRQAEADRLGPHSPVL